MTQWLQLSLIFLIVVISGCSESSPQGDSSSATHQRNTQSDEVPEIVVGGLYATKNDDGTYLVTKVLVVDDFSVHIRIYGNRFDELPIDLDPSVLSLGSINDDGGVGVGHVPVAKRGFFNDDPQLIKQVPVADAELDGYRLYLEAMGGAE